LEAVERISFLLFIAAIVSMFARRIKVPYTVGLTVTGVVLAFLPGVEPIHLTRNLVFSAFLPPLIFEASHQMAWDRIRRELPVTATLATLGVLISAGVVAVGTHFILAWSWPASVLVGVLISATDPVAVIATFRELGIKGRLQMLVESESLFNDGTAAVLFAISLAAFQGQSPSPGPVVLSFLLTVGGGVVCGGLVAGIALFLAGRTEDHLVEITFTTIAAYASFLIAEHYHFSGVLATMTAGIVLGNIGSLGSVSDKGREAVESFWEYIGFVANSLIFLLIGMELGRQPFHLVWLSSAVVILLVVLSRAAAVYPCSLLFSKSRNRVPWPYQHMLFWGGLRGALALALALGIPEEMEGRQQILIAVFAVVAFSVVLQGFSVGHIMRRLGIVPKEPLPGPAFSES
jgi:monovalent cation:H+ antiporter, CPA1 family